MTQHDLERVLRSTLNVRANTVTRGPAWDGADDPLDVGPLPGRRRQWLAPLAAAVVIIAVAAGAIALRHNDNRPDVKPGATAQLPVPVGTKAVDALGVEIFVPSSFDVDTRCSSQAVIRPIALTPAPSCPPLGITSTLVSISPNGRASSGTCVQNLELGGERTCLVLLPAYIAPPRYSATWPEHGVTVSADSNDRALVVRVFRSAHAVPIDRHGCAATRDPIDAPGQHDPAAVGGAPDVPADRPATSIGVCWYVANRLVASATLDTKGAGTVLRGAAAASGLFSASGSAACTRDDQSDAVVLAVRYVGGGTAEGVLHLGRCPSRSATDSQDGFVRNLARLAGMPLTLG